MTELLAKSKLLFGLLWIAVLGVAAPGRAFNYQDFEGRGPQFTEYRVRSTFRGKPARVILKGAKAWNFRTRLREDSTRGPNFAGHYTVVFWGCGSGCAQLAIVDAYTGKISWLPLETIDIPDAADAKPSRNFRLDSRLLIVTQSQYDAHATFMAYYYVINKNRLRLIRKIKVDNSDQSILTSN